MNVTDCGLSAGKAENGFTSEQQGFGLVNGWMGGLVFMDFHNE